MKNISSIHLHQIIGSMNSIRKCFFSLRFCSSTFLFEGYFIKFKYVILQDYFHKFRQSITQGLQVLFVIPSFQKPTGRGKTFPMWYITVKVNNVHIYIYMYIYIYVYRNSCILQLYIQI